MSGTITQAASPINLPVVLTTAGLVPLTSTFVRAQIDLAATASAAANGWPGYTSQLPGSMIEDITSTDTAAVLLCDQWRVELVNSITPYGCNAYILNQLGQIYGVPIGAASNTSVFVVFTGPPGYPISIGFIVSDGAHQYVIQDGGIIAASGQTQPLFCLATNTGTWAVPAGTVITTVTSVPGTISLTVTNPLPGLPGSPAETEQDYRAEVLQAGLAACQGSPAFLKTLLTRVPGVLPNLIAAVVVPSVGFKIIVGGGDPYLIAGAIFQAIPDLATLVGSTMTVTAVTLANPGKVTTALNHGYANGQIVTFSGMTGMTALNTGNYTATVVDEKSFTIATNTSGFPAYTGGGQALPNLRNVTVTIDSYPDSYTIPFVIPPQQIVAVAVEWNTSAPNFVAGQQVDQLAQLAIIAYINALPVGAPINVLSMQHAVHGAIAPVLSLDLISFLSFVVDINSVATSPSGSTFLIFGDPESYFHADTTTVTVIQQP